MTAPKLTPPTWTSLRREVPDQSRSSLRFDETAATVEVVRLGALKPVKQVDFLLEATLHMVGFIDRVAQVAPKADDGASDDGASDGDVAARAAPARALAR